MLKDIIEVHPQSDYRLYLKFEDGITGTVALNQLIQFSGIFEPLQDPAYFDTVKLNPEIGTIHWPNGADLDPDVLYAEITGQAIPMDVASSQVA